MATTDTLDKAAPSGLAVWAEQEAQHIALRWAKKRSALIAEGKVTEEQCKIGERLAQMVPCHYVRWNGTPVAAGEYASEAMPDVPTVPDLLITTCGPRISIKLSKRAPASISHTDDLIQSIITHANQALGVMVGRALEKHGRAFTFAPSFAEDGAALFCGEEELKLSLNASTQTISERLPVSEITGRQPERARFVDAFKRREGQDEPLDETALEQRRMFASDSRQFGFRGK